MSSHESLLKISCEPDPFLHFFTSQKGFSFLDELISSHLNVLVKEIASQDLFSVFKVESIWSEEDQTKSALGGELQVSIVEKDVIVVKEKSL